MITLHDLKTDLQFMQNGTIDASSYHGGIFQKDIDIDIIKEEFYNEIAVKFVVYDDIIYTDTWRFCLTQSPAEIYAKICDVLVQILNKDSKFINQK